MICAGLTGLVGVLLLALGPAPGDAAVHLYRTLLVQHGAVLWDNFWYAGQYPIADYSLVYYLPAALVGNAPLVFGAAVVSTFLFAAIAREEWGEAALWPTRIFAVCAAAPLFTGLYSYSFGFMLMLGAVRALQVRRVWLAIVLAALTLGCSALAFLFLCLLLGSVAVARRRLSGTAVRVGIALAAIAAFELFVLRVFPSRGVYPFHLVNLAAVLGVSTLGILLARRARNGAPILAFFALWAAGSIVASIVGSPIGDNWTRLDEFVFPLMVLTAALARFRPRALAVAALAVALGYNVTPYLLLIPYRLDGRPATARFWQPAITYVKRHSAPGYRVEVVPTAAHWESYWIPRAGIALARGFYRQTDIVDNPLFYSGRLDAGNYRAWLRAPGGRLRAPARDQARSDRGTPRGEAAAVGSRRADRRLPRPELDDLPRERPDAAAHRPGSSTRDAVRAHPHRRCRLAPRAIPVAVALHAVLEGERPGLPGAGEERDDLAQRVGPGPVPARRLADRDRVRAGGRRRPRRPLSCRRSAPRLSSRRSRRSRRGSPRPTSRPAGSGWPSGRRAPC